MPIKTMPIKMIVLSLVVLIAIAGAVAAVPLGGGSGGQSENKAPLDHDYDDGWVADVPDTISGHNVRHIHTPKNRACVPEPLILLQTTKTSMEEFLADPPDVGAVNAAIKAISGAPSEFNLSFSPGAINREADAAKDAVWNTEREERGCLPALADREIDDSSAPERGFAHFQNTTPHGHTDYTAQTVKIRTPSATGSNQGSGVDNFAAALNNVKTNTNYFMQDGILMKDTDKKIVWAEANPTPYAREYSSVPYYANTLYQFSITLTNGSWYMCAGNDQNISDEYECIKSDDAAGTYIRGNTRSTGVFFETGNTHDDWHTGFSATMTASHAKIHRNGTGEAWTGENRITQHHCDESYPVTGAMGQTTTLKNNGTGTWTLSGVPIACP